MSEREYLQLVARMLENAASPMISSDTGVEAAQKVGRLAAQEEIEWALAGGLAMYFYGSPRLTKDVDIIASQNLSLMPDHQLAFGGSSYTMQVGKYAVHIDWICAMMATKILSRRLATSHRVTERPAPCHTRMASDFKAQCRAAGRL